MMEGCICKTRRPCFLGGIIDKEKFLQVLETDTHPIKLQKITAKSHRFIIDATLVKLIEGEAPSVSRDKIGSFDYLGGINHI
jgi:hypothetical protein